MWIVSLESDDDLISVAQKLQKAAETEVGLPLNANFPFTQNLVNLKILQKEAGHSGKKLTFLPQDDASRELILSLSNGGRNEKGAFGFVLGRELNREVILGRKNWGESLKKTLLAGRSLRWRFWGGLAGLLFLGIFSAFFWARSFWPQTSLVLTVSAEAFVKSIDLEASLSAEKTDVQSRIIPAVKLTAVLKEKGDGQATGTKEVGEKAVGTVVVYNKTERGQTLKKGILLRTVVGKDLAYLVSNDLKVPAREATETAYVFGKAVAGVTAEKIGEDYNLPAGTAFSVGSFLTGELAAQNEQSFSGGSKREAKVVNSADQDKIFEAVSAALREKLKADLRSRLVGDQKLDDGVISFNILKKSYDKEAGEEAEKFNLELEEEAVAYVYSQGELQSLLTLVLAELVPPAYELSGEDQSVTIANVQAMDIPPRERRAGVLKFTAKVRGYIAPKLDLEKAKEELAGRTLTEAENYLNSLPGVDSHRLTLWPNLPSFARLPRFKERIEITVERK